MFRSLGLATLFAQGSTVLIGVVTGCDPHVIDVVELIPPPEGGSLPEAGVRREAGLDGGGASDASCTSAAALTVWPNCLSTINSDEWLVNHHDELTSMRPRLLVLHFYNAWTVDQAKERALSRIDALREGSRHHGYALSNAPPFLEYELANTVDLTDHPVPPNWQNPSSSLLPVTPTGEFDIAQLFTQTFADRLGFTDPASPSRNLTLCEIFEHGAINEVWLLVGESGKRAPPLILERKQVYDAAGTAIPGMFDPDAGGGGSLGQIDCRRTVRLAHLSPVRGAGCDLDVRGWNIAHMGNAVPYVDTNLRSFFNADFKSRFGAPFASFDEICDKNNTACVSYPSPTVATGTINGTTWKIDPFVQGCGTPEFPPNARWRYDWESSNTGRVQSRCEHYAMHDGDAGQDLPDIYSADKAAAYDRLFPAPDPDCGTGWQIYWRQSIPGFGTTARALDGTPMKNFWPFLFY